MVAWTGGPCETAACGRVRDGVDEWMLGRVVAVMLAATKAKAGAGTAGINSNNTNNSTAQGAPETAAET